MGFGLSVLGKRGARNRHGYGPWQLCDTFSVLSLYGSVIMSDGLTTL